MTFNGVSNTQQNFAFMGATDFEVAGGPADPPPLVKGVGTKRLGKGRVKTLWKQGFEGDSCHGRHHLHTRCKYLQTTFLCYHHYSEYSLLG